MPSSGPSCSPSVPTGTTLRLGDGPGSVDQPDVAECLREVTEQLACLRVDLFGEQTHVVDERHGFREDALRPFDLTGLGERLGKPECAQQDGALLTRQPADALFGAVAVDQAA